jgi:3-oxoacyl-[acyl-carrier-protein] synthase II
MAVSATKSMTGHLLGAAGALEGVLTVLAVHHRMAPGGDQHRRLRPGHRPRRRARRARALPDGDIAALNNSFGFGGHNVALVIKSV